MRCNESSIDLYDRCDKPSLLVTSPGSPDCHTGNKSAGTHSSASSVGRYSNRLAPSGPVPTDTNVGGRIQIKLGFDTSTLRLIVTLICAAGLTIRSNGTARNPYAKVS